jgi:hypothetical protein
MTLFLPGRDPGLRVCRSAIPAIDEMNPFKYLGFLVGTSGVTRPCLSNYPVWMTRLMALPLKPQQRMNLLRTHLLSRLFHGLQTNKISAANLRSIDRVTRHYVKRIAHLHLHTSDSLIHAPLREGGQGITELRVAIPNMFRSRIVKLREGADRDSTLSAVLGSPTVTRLLQRLDSLCGDDSPAQYHRREISGGCFSAGLQQASSDGTFRQWITRPPKGWSGGDWVRAVHLRTANLPTVGIPSNTAELRRCRGGCGANETVCHILQACPVVHDSRVRRHNAVATKIAIQCRKEGREVLEEPHVRHQDGTLYKPNLVVFRSPNDAVVCDVQISWEDGSSSTRIWQEGSVRQRQVPGRRRAEVARGSV